MANASETKKRIAPSTSLGNEHRFVSVVEQKRLATDFLRCLRENGTAKKEKGEERVRACALSLSAFVDGGWRMEEEKSKRKLSSESLRMSKKGFRHRSCRGVVKTAEYRRYTCFVNIISTK